MQLIKNLPLSQISTVFGVIIALLVIRVRLKAANKPTSLRKIMMPPLGMMTGFLMFISPAVWVPLPFAALSVLVGLLFSLPLIWTSHFEIREGLIFLKRSPAFVFILLGLLLLRIGLHSVVERYITLPQTGALFFVLAFSMILPWRVAMVRRYVRIEKHLHVSQ